MANPISYDVDADKKFKEAIDKARKSGLDLSFSMGEAARIIKKEAGKNFILKGTGKYPPLSARYKTRKDILAPGASILVGAKPGSVRAGKKISGGGISGKLRDSIISNTSDTVLRIGKRTLVFGTKATTDKGKPYPRYVQEGTKNRDGSIKMPGRKFLFFSQRMVRQIVRTIDADISNQITKQSGSFGI